MSSRGVEKSDFQTTKGETGVHPVVIKIVVGAAIWFLVVTWLSFAWDSETNFLLAIVILFFAFFFTLFLFTASFSRQDSHRKTSFREFLESNIRIGRGTMRGRQVLIQIALIPVGLALAATLIGLAWMILG
jgi:hypothetical protein